MPQQVKALTTNCESDSWKPTWWKEQIPTGCLLTSNMQAIMCMHTHINKFKINKN